MTEKTGEIYGGLVQSRNPAIYELPPMPDWPLHAVPGESPESESPLLYAEDLATVGIRKALIAIGDTMQYSDNGKGEEVVRSFDLSLISGNQLDEAIGGAEEIRANGNLPKELRQPVVDFLREAKGFNGYNTESGAKSTTAETSRRSKRAIEREEQERLRAELQREHGLQKQAELDCLTEWQQKNPPRGTNHFATIMPLLKTTVAVHGKFVVTGDSKLTEKTATLQDDMAQNPDRIIDEIKDSDDLKDFIAREDLSILSELYKYASEESHANWERLVYTDPEKFKEVFGQWMDVFDGFSEEYKATTGIVDGKMLQPSEALYEKLSTGDKDEPMLYEAGVHSYALHFLVSSMVAIGDTKPEEFRNMIYEIAQASFEHEDKFTRDTTLYLIAAAMGHSEAGNIATLNTPIARGLSKTDRLKGVDLRLCLQTLTFRPNIGPHSKRASKKLHKKYADIMLAARTLGVDIRDKDFEEKIYELSSKPYVEAIEAGELPESLYLKVKRQQEA